MEILKRHTDYALRALVGLAEVRETGLVSARELAREKKLAEPVLRKLLQKLSRAGIVKSIKGPLGGFRLARHLKDISVLEVTEVVQGRLAINRCFVGVRACPNQPGCRLSSRLTRFQRQLTSLFKAITLDQLAGAALLAPAARIRKEGRR